jgi:hypothetical protein
MADRDGEPEPARHPPGQHRRVVPLPPSPARSAHARSATSVPRAAPRTAPPRRYLVRITARPHTRGRAPPRRRRHWRSDEPDACRRPGPARQRADPNVANPARPDRRAASTDTVCSLLWGWYRYLTGRYVEAQQWLETALAAAPATFDPIIATPLGINVALGRGDVATALSTAQDVTANVDLAVRPAELATAIGAAFAWAGFAEEARAALSTAVTTATTDRRQTAHVLALVSLAVVEADAGTAVAASTAAERAIATAKPTVCPATTASHPPLRCAPAPAPIPPRLVPTRRTPSSWRDEVRPIWGWRTC